MIVRADISRRADELFAIIEKNFRLKNGLLARHYPPRTRSLFDHFDDLVPFFTYFGKKDFLLSQMEIILERGDSLVSLCANDDGVLLSRNVDEWMGGVYRVWKVTGDERIYKLLSESVAFIERNLMNSGQLWGAYHVRSGKASRYYEPWSAGLLEVCAEMKDDFPSLACTAKQVMRSWVSDTHFKKYGIFPFRRHMDPAASFMQERLISPVFPVREYTEEPPLFRDALKAPNLRAGLGYMKRKALFAVSPALYSQLMKSNSTPAFCMLAFYVEDGDRLWLDSLKHWCAGVQKHFVEGGRVFLEVNPLTGEKRAPCLTPAFIFSDVLCDAAWYIPEFRAQLPQVKQMIDYYWDTRLKSGLVPFLEGAEYAQMDNQVDFAVTMRRYAQLSGDAMYLDRAAELMECALREHYTPEGYRTFSGKTINKTIDPKYNVLLLKGMINLLTLGEPLYPDLQDLFKDR